jgi:hypothetical protein
VTELLNEDVMAAFDAVLSERAPAVRAGLQPGLDADAIRAGFASASIEPPQEALVWWGHFNGPRPDVLDHPLQLLPNVEVLSLATALRVYAQQRRVAHDLGRSWAAMDPDAFWAPTWMPILGIATGGDLALDCRGAPDEPCPVRVVFADEASLPEHGQVVAPSLGTLIERATAGLGQSPLRYDANRSGWVPQDAWTELDPSSGFAGS